MIAQAGAVGVVDVEELPVRAEEDLIRLSGRRACHGDNQGQSQRPRDAHLALPRNMLFLHIKSDSGK
jgi:hypothetical protein